MNRIVLLVTVETEPFDYNNYGRNASADRPYGEQPPLDPPTADAVRSEIQSNLESVWPHARVVVKEINIAELCVPKVTRREIR